MPNPTVIKGDLVVTGNLTASNVSGIRAAIGDADTETEGLVRQGVAVSAVATDANAAALATALNALITSLSGAGIIAAASAET